MNNLSFSRSIILALMLSLSSAAIFSLLSTSFTAAIAIRIVISFAALVYIAMLLKASHRRIGRLPSLVLLAGLMLLAACLPLSIGLYMVVHTGMIWLVRSLYFHNRLSVALLDSGLCVLSFAFAVWALGQSSSIFLAVWSYFLLQACVFPVLNFIFGSHRSKQRCDHILCDQKKFQAAHRLAESALRRVSNV